MKENDLKWYLENGFPKVVVERAKEIADLVEEFYGITTEELFISNVVSNGQEEYTSLWLFTKDDVVECKDFLTRSDIDIAKYGKYVTYFNIVSDSFDTLKASSLSSNIKLEITMGQGMKCILKSNGKNCDRLKKVAKRFLNEYRATK